MEEKVEGRRWEEGGEKERACMGEKVGERTEKWDGPPPCTTCPIEGRSPGLIGRITGSSPDKEAGALQNHPFLVGVGGNG